MTRVRCDVDAVCYVKSCHVERGDLGTRHVARLGRTRLFTPHRTRAHMAAHVAEAIAQQHPELERSGTPADQRLATRMKL